MTAPGSMMCTLCGFARTVETDAGDGAGVASAMAVAMHFMVAHPEIQSGVGEYVVLVPLADTDDRPEIVVLHHDYANTRSAHA